MEFNEEFALKYGLKKDTDYWFHKPSGHWIVKHDACVKIADQEDIALTIGVVLESRDSHKSIVVHGSMGESTVEMVGECHVGMQPISKEYPWCLAQKRGEDRCILRLVAPGGGIYSEIEAEDFKQTGESQPAPKKEYKQVEVPGEDTKYSTSGIPEHLVSKCQTEDDKIAFGKHKGKTWGALLLENPGYFRWMVAQSTEEHGEDYDKWSPAGLTALSILSGPLGGDGSEDEEVPF